MIIQRLPLRWRVTGAFAGVLVLVLLAVGGFVWWRMSSVLDQALDRDLRARAAEVGALVDQPGLALFPPGGPTLEADEKVAQILHADGTVVAASSFAGLRLVDPPRLHAALEGTVIWDRPGDEALDEDLRLLATPVNRSETYVVVVGSSLDERNEALTALLGTGLVGVAVALLAAVAAGYATAGLALSPVRAALTRQRRFVAEASHQLRTPLAVITTEVELAELAPDPATQAAALHSVGEEARRLTRLTDQLLLLVAHDERRLVSVRQQLPVPALLEAVAARHRRAVADHGRRITVTAEPGLIAYADEDRLASALDALWRTPSGMAWAPSRSPAPPPAARCSCASKTRAAASPRAPSSGSVGVRVRPVRAWASPSSRRWPRPTAVKPLSAPTAVSRSRCPQRRSDSSRRESPTSCHR